MYLVLVPKDKLAELKKLFDKVKSLNKFDINNIEAGREYVEAYVQFFKYAEGEDDVYNPVYMKECGHL